MKRRYVPGTIIGGLLCTIAVGMTAASGCFFAVPELVAASDAGPDVSPSADAEADVDGTPPDATLDARPDALVDGCPLGMVRGRTMCIDAREVSSKEYYAFVRAAAAANRMPSHPRCAWLTSFEPKTALEEDERPVVQVSWCQAWEYCKAGGKRLCGRAAENTPKADIGRPGRDEWVDACTAGDGRRYCYGSTFDPTACNTSVTTPDSDGREAVGSRPTCEGGLAGLFDMGGNVAEWSDGCDNPDAGTGESDDCVIHPGNFRPNTAPENISQCTWLDGTGRVSQQPYIGFRCCATPE